MLNSDAVAPLPLTPPNTQGVTPKSGLQEDRHQSEQNLEIGGWRAGLEGAVSDGDRVILDLRVLLHQIDLKHPLFAVAQVLHVRERLSDPLASAL